MPAEVTDPYIRALDRVLELTVFLSEDMTRGLAQDGLTGSRTHLLWVLRQLGPSTQQALASALKVTSRNVTGLVDGLVDTGFVTREPHPSDRRATLVTFTEHGTAVIERMEGEQRELADALFRDLPEFNAFSAGLDAVLDRLKTLAATSPTDQNTAVRP
ncbi:MarR family transcriptional regulator [Diaminobutyricimonas sp. TR449]|uniref:MarR family winged helix-turn-helix transcriptional regulator n=1 Tax=Diaminobutyricimonas sp. TR449 TaxID=2708076 RepID=UPI00141E8F16|nr:MarR family transcriptional regulator [Diaminobutyricimonas sp. TR449]